MRPASRNEVSTVTSKVCRFRLLTPMIFGAGFERIIEFGVVVYFDERGHAETRRQFPIMSATDPW